MQKSLIYVSPHTFRHISLSMLSCLDWFWSVCVLTVGDSK